MSTYSVSYAFTMYVALPLIFIVHVGQNQFPSNHDLLYFHHLPIISLYDYRTSNCMSRAHDMCS